MKLNKISTFIALIISIIIIPIYSGLGMLFNDKLFHQDAIEGTESHFEPKVYITPTGECYHSSSCSYVHSRCEIGLYEAKSKGYRACEHCSGTPEGEIFIEGIEPQTEQNDYFKAFFISFTLVILIPLSALFFCVDYEKRD